MSAWAQPGGSHAGSLSWLPWDREDKGVISKAFSSTWLAGTGTGEVQTARAGTWGSSASLSILVCSVHVLSAAWWLRGRSACYTATRGSTGVCSEQENETEAVSPFKTQPRKPHSALLLLCSPRSSPKEPIQFQSGHLLTKGEGGRVLEEHMKLNTLLWPILKNTLCHRKFDTILLN